MEPQPHDDASSVSLSRGLRANRVCDQFEAAWKAGTRPRIDEFLTGIPRDEWPDLLRELLILDLHYRRQLGESLTLDSYRAEYPALQLDSFADLFAERFQPAPSSAAGETFQFIPSDAQSPSGDLPRIRYLGDYELVAEIARGGMGVVYKARQISLNRIVAVKMILAGQFATKSDHDRFHSEAQAAALLDHPNIVPIFEVGEHEGQHYFSMGYVDGSSLSARLVEGPLPPKEAAELVATVAEAVEYAHHQGVIHRDIKPSNILIDSKGRSRVTDFGLAKRVGAPSTPGRGNDLTATGQVLGTPSYMPPEQAAGQIDAIGPASDVYALGALLYSTVTGRPPFQAATALETMQQVLQREPVALRQLNATVPRDLETIVLKCLEKSVPRRYATAQALANDLRRFVEGRPILARPVGRWEHTWRWCRRNPVVAALTAAVFLSVLTGAVASGYYAIRAARNAKSALTSARLADQNATGWQVAADQATSEKRRADAKTAEAMAEKSQKAKQLFRAEFLLYAGQIASAQREWESNNVAGGWQYLNACRADFRGWEHDYLYSLFAMNQRTLKGHSAEVLSVAYSPDGKRIVSGSQDKTLKVWDAITGQETLTLRGHTGEVTSVAFSPDGKRIASGSADRTLKLWDATTGRETLTLKGHTGAVGSVAFSPDGKRIVSASEEFAHFPAGLRGIGTQMLRVWDPTTGQETLTPAGLGGIGTQTVRVWDATTGQETLTFGGAAMSVAFSPDGKRIVSGGLVFSGGLHGSLTLWDSTTGQETLTLKGHTGAVLSVAFSPDGKRIVSASSDKTLKVWDATTGRETLTLRGHANIVASAAFSPDGKRIVSGSYDRTLKLWDATTGQETLTLRGHTNIVASAAFSPDGKRIVSGGWDGTLKLWDTIMGQETLTLQGHTSGVASVAFTPDGKRIVSGSLGETLRVWDATTGRQETPMEHTGVYCVAFSPDGKRIASGGGVGTVGANTLKLWDATTGQETLTLRGHTNIVTCVAFSPDGKQIVSGSEDKTLKLWDATTGEEMLTLRRHPVDVAIVAFSPDGKQIVSGGGDNRLRVWDAATGQQTRTLKGHSGRVTSITFSPDGKRIVSGSEDKTLKLWDATTGEEMLTLKGHTGAVGSVAFSPDGKRIASGSTVSNAAPSPSSPDGKQIVNVSWDGSLKLWDATTGQEILTLRGHTIGAASVAFSPDGKRIASGSYGNTLKLWDAITGLEALTLKGHIGDFNIVAFSPDGKRIVTGGIGKLMLWDATSGRREMPTLLGHTEDVSSVAFSPDGKRLVTGNQRSYLMVWDETSDEGRPIVPWHPFQRFDVNGVAFSPDRERFVVGGGDGTLTVWDAANGQEALALKGHTVSVNGVAFSPDGKRIASGSEDKTLKVWDAITGRETLSLRGHTEAVKCVAFSPDGKRIVSGSSDKTLKLWDATTGQETLTLKGHAGAVASVAFSPDGKRIVSGSSDKTLKLWDATTGLETLTLQGHTGDVTCVAFSPDGKRIASGSADRTLKIWDASNNQEQQERHTLGLDVSLPNSGRLVDAIERWSWSPGGDRIAYIDRNVNALRIRDLATGEISDCVDDAHDPAWSPGDGRWIAFERRPSDGADAEQIWLVSPAGGESKKLCDGAFPSWSSNGKTLYCYSTKRKKIVAVQLDSPQAQTTDVCDMPYRYPSIAPDGTHVAFLNDGELTIIERKTGATVRICNLGGWNGFLASWSPDGKQIAFGSLGDSNQVGLWFLDATSGRKIKLLDGPCTMPGWSPDGKKFAFQVRDGDYSAIWMIDGKALVELSARPKPAPGTADAKVLGARQDSQAQPAADAKAAAPQRQAEEMVGKAVDAKSRKTTARVEALLPDRKFSKVEISSLEDEVAAADMDCGISDARLHVGFEGMAEGFESKAELCTAKGRLAWAQGDLPQCGKQYDDALAFWQNRYLILRYQHEERNVPKAQLADAESHIAEARLLANRVRGKMISAGLKPPPSSPPRAELLTLENAFSHVTSVAFSPQGKRIVGAVWDDPLLPGLNARAKVWDATSGQELLTLPGTFSHVASVAFSPDGKRIVGAVWDDPMAGEKAPPHPRLIARVKVWEATSGQEQIIFGEGFFHVTGVAFSPDGTRIVSAGLGGAKTWDSANGHELLTLKAGYAMLTSVAFGPDGKRIVGAGLYGAKVWDSASGQELLTLKAGGAIFSPDGKRIVGCCEDGKLRIWDAASGQELLMFEGYDFRLGSFSFSPDGKRIVSAGWEGAKIFDSASGHELLTLKASGAMVTSVAYSPDGKRIVGGCGDGKLRIWDATIGGERPAGKPQR